MGRAAAIASFSLMSVFALTSCDKNDNKDNTNNTPYTVSGNASGSQMVPTVSGNGTAAINGTYNPANMTLTYTTSWSNLSGAPTSAGFYSGATGTNGTAMGSNWSLGTGLTGTGTFTSSMVLTQDQANQLTSGGWYYTLGTANHSGGEVRGQIAASR
jgi:hypothetical protein